MSSFTSPLRAEVCGEKSWRVLEPFRFYLTQDKNHVIEIPSEFVTDFASVPRILWSIFAPVGKYTKAALVHDYLYRGNQCFVFDRCIWISHYKPVFFRRSPEKIVESRKNADRIFLDAMLVCKTAKWRAYTMYFFVRIFGRVYFENYKKEKK